MVLLSSGRKKCSHCLKFDTKHEGIGIPDTINMTKLKMFFPNYVTMIDFIINSCLIQQIQGSSVVLLDLVHCNFLGNEFDITLFDWILFFVNTYWRIEYCSSEFDQFKRAKNFVNCILCRSNTSDPIVIDSFPNYYIIMEYQRLETENSHQYRQILLYVLLVSVPPLIIQNCKCNLGAPIHSLVVGV